MGTFIDWPSQFMYEPRRVTDEPAAVEARRQSRQDALRTPEQRITTNPFRNAPLVPTTPPLGGVAGAGVPEKRVRPRATAPGRPAPQDNRPNMPDIGNREVTPGGVEVGVTQIPGGTAPGGRLRLPNPLAALNFDRPAPDTNQTFAQPDSGPLGRFSRDILDRQGGGVDYINPITGKPQQVISAPGNSPGPRFAPSNPGAARDTGTRIGDPGFELRPDTRTQAEKDAEMDRLRAWKRGVIADQRREAMNKRDEYLNNKRNEVYAAWSQPNVPRTSTFDTFKADAVPFVTREEQKLWKGAGINMPYGFQGPEYTTNLFSARGPGNRTQGAGSVVTQMSSKQLQQLRDVGMKMGLYNPNTFLNLPTADLTDIVVYSQLQAKVNESDFTNVEQLMDFALKTPSMASGGYGSSGGGGGGGASGPQNRVDRIYNKTSVDQGRALLRQTMRELLGREPTDTEVKTYVSALNKQEAKVPQVVSTTYSAGGTTATQKTLSEAPVADEVLRAQAEGANDEEIAQYKATGFMGTLDSMIGGL